MASEGSFSSKHSTSSRKHPPSNEIVAANLSKSFATPQRPASNSARKRRHLPNLARSTASPSHGTYMANIFHDASVTLQGLTSPPLRSPSNSKKTRIPLSVARGTRFGDASTLATANRDEMEGASAADNGVQTPQWSLIHTPEAVTNIAFENRRLPESPSPSSTPASLLSSPMPIQATSVSHESNIDMWLNDVLSSAGEDVLDTPETCNKENAGPADSPSLSIRPPIRHVDPQNHNHIVNNGSPARARRFQNPQTPQGHLSEPPRRKKARINDTASGNLPMSCTSGQNFTIHEDNLVSALAELSPQVERYRKGKGPKRERRKSYFDEDVLPAQGRKPLGESAQNAQLTKSEPFVAEATSAAFDFRT